MNKKLLITLVGIGIILRLVLAVFTYHADITAYSSSSKLILTEGHVFDFYDAIAKPDANGQPYGLEFVYQPLAYLIPAAFYAPLTPFLKATVDGIRQTDPFDIKGKLFYLPLLFYKYPMLLADISIIFLLPLLFDRKRDKQLAMLLWALNPVAIYVSSVMGQIDTFLTLFFVLSLVQLKRNNFLLASVFITLSTLTKPTGLILLPLIAIFDYHHHRSLRRAVVDLVPALLTLVTVILPFISSSGYRASLSSYHLEKSIFSGISIAPGTAIPFFFIFFVMVVHLSANRRLSSFTALGATVFASLALTHFHPQWFLWVTPWVIYNLIQNRNWFVYLVTIFSWIAIIISFGPDLHLNTLFGLHLVPPTIPMVIADQLSKVVLLSRAWLVAVFVLDFLMAIAPIKADAKLS